LGFVHPLVALIASFCLLGLMLYKRLNLGPALTATAMLLALLSLDWQQIPTIIYSTTVDTLTISVVLATFGIMLLSKLYKETGVLNNLSESASRLIHNPKIVSSLLPAIVGFLPVAGGALMSAPLVDSETEKLGLKPEKKAYVNVWFRHTIFPVYPLSQVLIITAALTGTAVPLIIIRQIPVVLVMLIVGYFTVFWKASAQGSNKPVEPEKTGNQNSNLKRFLVAFSPILATIIVVVFLGLAGFGLAEVGFDVFIATFAGLFILAGISKPNLNVVSRSLKGWDVYTVTLAAYSAFLLRNVIKAAGIPDMLTAFAVNESIDIVLLLALVPAILGFVTGSPSGGVALSVAILAGTTAFSAKTAALIYISAFLGYIIVPTHLCLAFTVNYFKCPFSKVYRYMIPSFLISYATALLVYFLV